MRLEAVYRRLHAEHGQQHWWPAETVFEVMVGAVLTQNTAWVNVERALKRLTTSVALTPDAVLALSETDLAEAIRPVGYYNVKARRLRAYCAALIEAGGIDAVAALSTDALRSWLLGIHGIGPETADDILLYGFDRPVFVVDAYTRRLFERLGMLEGGEPYEAVRAWLEQVLGPDARLYNQYHALIVQQAKEVCRSRKPRCEICCLARDCPSAVAADGRDLPRG